MNSAKLGPLYLRGLSMMQIARQIGRSFGYVRGRLRREGIASRTNSEGVHLATRATPIAPSELLMEIIDGLLLGDASIEAGAIGSRLCLTQTIKHFPWIEQVRGQLEAFGLELGDVDVAPGFTTIKGKRYCRNAAKGFRTRSYLFLTQERERWYPGGEKHVPADVRLTPQSIAHWYFGDGTVGCKGYHAKFCTDSFTKMEVQMLMHRMREELGWSPLLELRNRILLCRMYDRQCLLEMVKSRTPSCFVHKLKLRVEYKRLVLSDIQREEFIGLRRLNWSLGRLSKHFGLTKSAVRSLCVQYGLGGRRGELGRAKWK